MGLGGAGPVAAVCSPISNFQSLSTDHGPTPTELLLGIWESMISLAQRGEGWTWLEGVNATN